MVLKVTYSKESKDEIIKISTNQDIIVNDSI